MRTLIGGGVVIGFILVLLLLIRTEPINDVPSDAGDAECHDLSNLRVDGATRIHSIFGTGFVAGKEHWPEVVQLMQDLAEQRGLFFRDASVSRPGVDTLALSVCAPGQPVVMVNEMEWDLGNASDFPRPPESEPLIQFPIYGNVPESVWQPVAADLVELLENRWPNQVRFRYGNSYVQFPRPDFLNSEP